MSVPSPLFDLRGQVALVTGAGRGLGLAIVAAIARMHAGRTLAESARGTTRVGFTLSAA